MSLKDDLHERVREFVRTHWDEIPDGRVVPEPEALTFGNTGINLDGCVFYADLRRSTEMVDQLTPTLAAEYYKAFLHCAGKIIKHNDGDITAYDGDRVMAIFLGADQAVRAVYAAFHLNYAVRWIINPEFLNLYGAAIHRPLQHTVGIDCGKLLAAKAGVRDDRDLVWVGPAANYAAKLNSFDGLDPDFPTRITSSVYAKLPAGYFFRLTGTTPVWEGPHNNLSTVSHYRSNIWIEF